MLLRFFRWLFTSAPKPAAPERPSAPISFFTTDTDVDNSAERAMRVAIWGENVIPKPTTRVIQQATGQDGAVTWATDSTGAYGDSLKAAFALNQVGIPEGVAYWYGSQGFIGYQMMAILAQHWLINKACLIPARDAARKGFKLTANGGVELSTEQLDAIKTGNKRFKLNRHLIEFAYFARVFGIRIAIFKIETGDPDYYVKPFNPDSITPGSYRGISQVDPYWCIPELTNNSAMNPAAMDFYEPTYWVISGERYHKSHLVITRGPDVADILKPSYLYGGLSLTQRIYERVYASERTANEAPMLAMNKRNTIFYTDVAKAMQNQEQFEAKLGLWARFRDNWGVKVAQMNVDKVEQIDTSLADLDTVIMTNYQLVAAIANTPATKLLGTTPKGFNSTGDYETENYHEELETIQSHDMEPLVDRHIICLMRSDIVPRFAGMQPISLECTWNPPTALTPKEQAELNKTNADADKALFDAGAIDGHDIRARLAADEHSGHSGLDLSVTPEPPPPETGNGFPQA